MPEPEPIIRITRGTPTAEELAALVGALLLRRRPEPAQTPAAKASRWARSARPGAGASGWRTSLLPR